MNEDLSPPTPHLESEIEWWYFHGLLDDRSLLLVCLWRYRREAGQPDAFMTSYSLTAIDNTRRVHATFIDESCLHLLRSICGGIVRSRKDPFLEAFLEETAGGQSFEPYQLTVVSGIEATAAQVSVQVGPCLFRSDAAGQAIHLEIDDAGLSLVLDADGTAPGFAMGAGGSFTLSGKRMSGWTKPRLDARGTVTIAGATEPVAGVVWFDHQWGDWSVSHRKLGLHHPEWIYFAALLDDGRSLVMYQRKPHRGALHERQFAYVTVHETGRPARMLHEASIAVHDYCESMRTGNLYEYGWTVELPELDARLEFEPFHPNHEIRVFNRLRGILEVGCRVTGRVGGRACGGWGFVEAFGETLDVNEFFWGQKKTNLAAQLEKTLPRSSTAALLQRICQLDEPLVVDHAALDRALFAPLWSMMDRGGKGWRSAWLTTCYYAFGRDDLTEQVRALLPVTELLHTGSLVIDDFQDGSTLRRGRPTLHREVGADLAINAGCFCYFLPLLVFEELEGLSDAQRARIYAIVANAMRQGHLGQAMDLMWSKGRFDVLSKLEDVETTRMQLIEQYRLKSGAQLEAIARISGILAGAPAPWVEAAARYSRAFGVVFQIVDDVIGIRDGRRKLGKAEGEDVRNGKLNMVLLYALSALKDGQRESWLKRVQEPRRGEGLRAARELIEQTNSIERCLDDAESLLEPVSDALRVLPATDARILMRSVPRWLLLQQRQHRSTVRQPGAKGSAGRRKDEPCVS